jgi:hypothetical protein
MGRLLIPRPTWRPGSTRRTRWARTFATAGAILGVTGCGGDVPGGVAAHVGGADITSAAVEHRMATTAGGHAASDPSRRQAQLEQAEDYLIASQWLLGEAARDGLTLTASEVSRQLAQKISTSFPGGASGLHEFLQVTGQNMADVSLEAKAELAVAKLREMLASREPPITPAQVSSYYAQHRQSFTIPERRELNIVAYGTRAAAQAIRLRVEAGKSFASMSEHQSIELPAIAYSHTRGTDAVLARAIHLARPHVLVGPVRFYRVAYYDYYMLEVLGVTPARQRTLAEVQGTIARRLAAEQQPRTLAAFIASWRSRWMSRTDCSPGYVIQKCRQYTGSRTPEDPMSFD